MPHAAYRMPHAGRQHVQYKLIYCFLLVMTGFFPCLHAQTDSTDTEVYYTIDVDTLFAYESGLDSIFLLTEDTTGVDTVMLREMSVQGYFPSSDLYSKEFVNPMEMGIDIGFLTKPVNEGLFGLHVGNIFTPGALPHYETMSEDALEWLAELRPKSLRFPAGGSAKFMHLLPYKDGDDEGSEPDPIKGYGYDIEEIIRFYDVTNEVIDVPTTVSYEDIIDDMEDDGDCDECELWMNKSTFEDDFEGFYKKWDQQEALDPLILRTLQPLNSSYP